MRALWIVMALVGCGPPMTYPRSPQWRSELGQFENPPGSPPRPNLGGLFRWQASRPEPGTYPAFTPATVKNDGAALRANHDRLSITWIGHATLLVQVGGVNVLTDPIFSTWMGFFRRYAPPGVARADLPPVDVVVISHNHRDHLDAASVKSLGPGVLYVVPLGLARWFRRAGLLRVVELDWWQSTQVTTARGGTATITMVPAQHWSRRSVADENESLWGGYVIDAGGERIYFAGDTGYPAAFREIGRRFPGIDYALMPIGAYAPRWFMHSQHVAPEEVAAAFRQVGARWLVPMHWATFHLSDEPMDEPPRVLRQVMGRASSRIVELAIGETRWGEPPPAPADPIPDPIKE